NIDSNFAGYCQNTYSYWSAFNSDDTRLLIECNSWALLYDFDAATDTPTFHDSLRSGQMIQVEPEGAVWSHDSPNILYALGTASGSQPPRVLYRLDASLSGAARFTALHDFTAELNGRYNYSWEVDQLSKSDDDRRFSFTTRPRGGSK